MMFDDGKPSTPGEMLEHVGVRGMKWGVRKKRTGSGSRGGVSKKDNRKKAGAVKVSEAKAAPQQSVGRQRAKKVLKVVGATALTTAAASAGSVATIAWIVANFDSGETQYNGYSKSEHESGKYPSSPYERRN